MPHIALRYSIGAFTISIGLGIVATAVPLISAKDYLANELELGIIGTLLALPYMLSCPLFGKISDRIGRYPILFSGVAIYSITSILYAFCGELSRIMILRIIEGLALAMIWPAMDAIFGELSKSYNKAISVYNFSWSLGLMIGSMFIGTLLLIFDVNVIFLVAVVFNIIGITMFYNNANYSSSLETQNFIDQNFVDGKNIVLIFYSMFVLGLSLFSFYSLFPLHALNCQIDDYLISYMIGMVGLARTAVFILYGKISNLISHYALFMGMFLLGISMFICWMFSSIMGFVLATIMLGASVGLIYSKSISFITYVSSRGLYAGMLELALGLGELIGPLTMGTIGLFLTPSLPYLLMSILAIFSSMLFLIRKFFYVPKTKTSI